MNSSPPLRVWLWGAMLAASMLALLVPLRQLMVHKVGVTAAEYTQRYLTDPAHQDGPRVLGLGSSLLWAATPPAYYQKLQGVHWMRLTKSGGGMGHLRAVFDVFDQTPPDVLVIDANLLLPSSPAIIMEEMRYALGQAAGDTFYSLLERIGVPRQSAHRLLSDQQMPFSCDEVHPDALQKQMRRLIREQNITFATTAIEPELLDRLQRLSQRGVRIVVLELSRSAAMEKGTTLEKHRWLQRWQSVLPPGPRVSYINSPIFQEPDLYCDGRHMNDAGARRLAPWWTAQLQNMAKEH